MSAASTSGRPAGLRAPALRAARRRAARRCRGSCTGARDLGDARATPTWRAARGSVGDAGGAAQQRWTSRCAVTLLPGRVRGLVRRARAWPATATAATAHRGAGLDVAAGQVPTVAAAGARWHGHGVGPRPGRRAERADVDAASSTRARRADHAAPRVHNDRRRRRTTLAALRPVLPVPPGAAELLDLTGRWCRERSARSGSRSRHGTWVQRSTRRGRTGHDATAAAGGRHRRASASGTARSGRCTSPGAATTSTWPSGCPRAPGRTRGARRRRAAARPARSGSAPGESYATPLAATSPGPATGLDGARRPAPRARCGPGPATRAAPRPVVLNTWEAVYFDHDLDRLTALADAAAPVGVERFVLDDGWFRGRRDDTAGLGDWYVDEGVWPDGLHPLVDHVARPRHAVRALGRAGDGQPRLRPRPRAPGLGARRRPRPTGRRCLAPPAGARPGPPGGVRRTCWSGSTRWSTEYAHRLPQVGPQPRPARGAASARRRGRARRARRRPSRSTRCSTSCAAGTPGWRSSPARRGGARVDLGILERTDRVWASDCNDALERQQIQRWTGSAAAAGAGRRARRAAARRTPPDRAPRPAVPAGDRAVRPRRASSGTSPRCTPDELAAVRGLGRRSTGELRAAAARRPVVRADHTDDGTVLHGVVAQDGSGRRSSASPGWPRRPRRCPAGCRCRASTRSGATS